MVAQRSYVPQELVGSYQHAALDRCNCSIVEVSSTSSASSSRSGSSKSERARSSPEATIGQRPSDAWLEELPVPALLCRIFRGSAVKWRLLSNSVAC